MRLSIFFSAAAAVSTLAAALPVQGSITDDEVASYGEGVLNVHNQCSFSVYLRSVSNDNKDPPAIEIPPNKWYNEGFHIVQKGGGVSIKVARIPGETNGFPIEQLEYTYAPGGPTWYDLSEVDGHPFDGVPGFVYVWPNGGGAWKDKCTSVTHDNAYQYSTEDTAVHNCPSGTDINMTLCA